MNLQRRILAVLIFCLPFDQGAGAATKPDFTEATNLIQGWIDHGYFPGAAFRVVQDNQVVCEKFFGGYTATTPVALVSATKWIEVATVMTLVDDGKIDLDAPVSRYLPSFTGDMGSATVRQCLSHTSGINSIAPVPPDDQTDSIAQRADQLADGTMHEKPGARFTYGGNALNVAGRIAEVVTGKPWEILFADRIAKPCQLQYTVTGMNLWYVKAHGGAPWCTISTLDDYCHFLEMLANDGVYHGTRVLSHRAIQEMQADQVHDADLSGTGFCVRAPGTTHRGVYGFGEWREAVDAQGNALVLSCPGWLGFYPWIDKRHHAYAVFVGDADTPASAQAHFGAFFETPKLSRLVDAAFNKAE
jgi:CubicO group peptidase (beta-lactamase class C family)